MSIKVYTKPRPTPLSRAPEPTETNITYRDIKIPDTGKIADDFILLLDTRGFTARIKEKLKEIEEEEI